MLVCSFSLQWLHPHKHIHQARSESMLLALVLCTQLLWPTASSRAHAAEGECMPCTQDQSTRTCNKGKALLGKSFSTKQEECISWAAIQWNGALLKPGG